MPSAVRRGGSQFSHITDMLAAGFGSTANPASMRAQPDKVQGGIHIQWLHCCRGRSSSFERKCRSHPEGRWQSFIFICMLRRMSYDVSVMSIDYMQILNQLMEERESWLRRQDEAVPRALAGSELIWTIIKLLPPEQRFPV